MPELERKRRENGDVYDPREGDEIVSGDRVINIDGIDGDLVELRICDRGGALIGSVCISRGILMDQVAEQARVAILRRGAACAEHIAELLGIPPERPTQAERRAVETDDAGF